MQPFQGVLRRFRFMLERLLVRGTQYQFLVMAALIGLVSLLGGVLVHLVAAPDDSLWDSIWWAFLRLSDPGYLGDDEGFWRRVVSTVLTVSGYVLFLGSLVAILTQWLSRQMRSLERGMTPVALSQHIVILGWGDHTLPLLRELWLAEGRVKRFLTRMGSSRPLRLVVLTEDLRPELAEELRNDDILGRHFNSVILRSGSSLNNEHLSRAGCLRAAAIIVPASSYAETSGVSSDVETIKILLSLNAMALARGQQLPYVVAEIQQSRQVAIAHRAYQGPLEVIASDAAISQLMVQSVDHPGLLRVYTELLSHDQGNNLYLYRDPGLAGNTVSSLRSRLPKAILLGLVSGSPGQYRATLNPVAEQQLHSQDAILVLARRYEDIAFESAAKKAVAEPIRTDWSVSPGPSQPVASSTGRHVLIVGWSRKVPALVREFLTYGDRYTRLTVFSSRPISERTLWLQAEGLDHADLSVQHVVGDVTSDQDWHHLEVRDYHSILLMSSDRLASGEEADARTIVGYLQLEGRLRALDYAPQVLLELSDPNNERLLGSRAGEAVISPLMLSHLLVHVALRRELLTVYNDLFSAVGPEITDRPLSDFGLAAGSVNFDVLQQQLWAQGATLLGIDHAPHAAGSPRQLVLNPQRGKRFDLRASDRLIVLQS